MPGQTAVRSRLTKTPDDIEAEARRERLFVKTYVELIAATETQARGVFMHVWCREAQKDEEAPAYSTNGHPSSFFDAIQFP